MKIYFPRTLTIFFCNVLFANEIFCISNISDKCQEIIVGGMLSHATALFHIRKMYKEHAMFDENGKYILCVVISLLDSPFTLFYVSHYKLTHLRGKMYYSKVKLS